MKVIMYHYVRRYSGDYPNFKFLHIDNFIKQIRFFEKNFGLVSRQDWDYLASTGDHSRVSGKVLLTFDDAMSCHYEFVHTALKSINAFGIFFVPTGPYTSARVLDVHKIHLLTGAIEASELHRWLLANVSTEIINLNRKGDFENFTYLSQFNLPGVSEIKRILNYFIDDAHRTEVIESICKYFDVKTCADQFYVSLKQLRDMVSYGHLVGSHTVNHPVMSKLSAGKQKAEIHESFEFLSNLTDPDNLLYCHPYGGFHSFNDSTVDALRSCGVKFAFNVESRDLEPADTVESSFWLPRYDCNEFPFGAAG